eukprot:TRINITY_DN35593_c0_g1_i1.p1 TRINITY_DN35593_c0_g1~~TRINITY_DN35593_c0_g1_i1.p1  ORF type:complete len:399 (+),score=68.36 TRINITY_DN35593_c0_g1_i1:109-1305(+)
MPKLLRPHAQLEEHKTVKRKPRQAPSRSGTKTGARVKRGHGGLKSFREQCAKVREKIHRLAARMGIAAGSDVEDEQRTPTAAEPGRRRPVTALSSDPIIATPQPRAIRGLQLCSTEYSVDSTVRRADATLHFEVLYPVLRRMESRMRRARPNSSQDVCGSGDDKRAALVDWMLRCHDYFDLRSEVLFLAVSLLDSIVTADAVHESLPTHFDPDRWNLPLVAAAILFVAAKFEDIDAVPELAELVDFGKDFFKAEDLCFMEILVLQQLEYRLMRPTALSHLHWFVELCSGVGAPSHDPPRPSISWLLANYIGELSLRCKEISTWPPSDHAAAIAVTTNLLLARKPLPDSLRAACCAGPDEEAEHRMAIIRQISRRCIYTLKAAEPGIAAFEKHSAKIER